MWCLVFPALFHFEGHFFVERQSGYLVHDLDHEHVLAGLEILLLGLLSGFQRPLQGEGLVDERADVVLRLPLDDRAAVFLWKEVKISRRFRQKNLRITIRNNTRVQKGVTSVEVNGKKIEGNLIPCALMKEENEVLVLMGR